MKRLAILFFMILLIPFASAMLVVDGPSKGIYGVGEAVDMSVSITPDHHTFGMLKLAIACKEEVQVFSKVINIDKDKTLVMSQDLSAPPNYNGECKVKATLTESGQADQVVESKVFTISNELNGNFSFTKTKIQLGNDIGLNGNIHRLNGEEVNGIGTLYLKLVNSTAIAKNTNIENGVFAYKENSAGFTPGIYDVQVTVNDVKGSSYTFNLEQLEITDEITITASLDKQEVLPGEEVTISGNAKTATGEDFTSIGNAKTVFGGIEKSIKLSSGKFSSTFTVPKDFKSGEETVYVTIEDGLGNRGETSAVLNVIAVPTSINLAIEGDIKAGSTITITPTLYDQTSATMPDNVKVKIISSDGKAMLENDVASGAKMEYQILNSAMPGSWRVNAAFEKVEKTEEFQIAEFVNMLYKMDGSNLVVNNDGNARYKGGLEVIMEKDGQEAKSIHNVNIGVGEEKRIDLAKGIESGTYNIKVGDANFEGIQIIGKKRQVINWEIAAYIVLGLAVLLLLIFIAWQLTKHNRNKPRKEAPWDEEKARQKIFADLKKPNKHEKPKFNNFKPGVRREELIYGSHDAETIFGRKRKKQKDSETMSSWGNNSYEPPKDDDKKKGDGLFNMFG